MSDTTFREKQTTPTGVEPKAEAKISTQGSTTTIEPPFLDYSREHGQPFVVEHFQLGDRWNDSSGGFFPEVTAIESYLAEQVTNREVENSLKAIKKRIKEIEKVTGMDKEDRKIIKLEVMADYVKFLMKKSDTYKNITRYGNN